MSSAILALQIVICLALIGQLHWQHGIIRRLSALEARNEGARADA